MYKNEATEATPILQRALRNLLNAIPSTWLTASDLRTACSLLSVNAEKLLYFDQAGPQLSDCFEKARKIGATLPQIEWVRRQTVMESPVTVGAMMVKNSIMRLCLVTEGRIIADMIFTSRRDVDALMASVNQIFADAEEIAADEMDQMSYRGIVELHANVIFYLVQTARPLPVMLKYSFFSVMSSLMMSNRLYYDASRADELRAENKVVHPLFMPLQGQALSQ